MNLLAIASPTRHLRLDVSTTRATEFIDITDQLDRFVRASRIDTGILLLHTLHTTTAVVVNEREPLLLGDFERLLERVAPCALPYWHDEMALRPDVDWTERVNGHAHGRALFLPSSVALPVVDRHLKLGRWQRVFFVELDGPRQREASAVLLGEALP